MMCTICGLEYSSPSMGGPGICPSCDCGNFGIAAIQRQAKRIAQLEAALRDISYATAPIASVQNSSHEWIYKRCRDALTAPETACELCEGSCETGHTHYDGTQYSDRKPPCVACGGTGKKP
jgi:hypothetical protein